MSTERATNAQPLHERLGGLDFDAMLSDETTSAGSGSVLSQPVVRAAMSLKQVAGCQAGGAFSLDVGSYRFGQSPGSPVLETGTPQTPRFGLTVDTTGIVTLHPPTDGSISLNGDRLTAPRAVAVGQIIDAGVARFMLDSSTQIVRRRADESSTDVTEPMPTPVGGAGVDEAIVRWALQTRDASMARRRDEMFGPHVLSTRPLNGTPGLVAAGPESVRFGKVAVAVGDLPYAFPGDLSAVNEATQQQLAAMSTLPSVPLDIDLLTNSVAVVGNRNAARPVAAWIALGVAAQALPSALGVTLHARGSADEWPWIQSLPHNDGHVNSHVSVTVIDEEAVPAEVAPTGTIVLVDEGQVAPVGCSLILEVGPTSASLTNTSEGWSARDLTPTGVSSTFALDAVFELRDALGLSGGGR